MKFLALLVICYFLEYHLHRNRVTTGIAGTLMNKYRTGMKEESETTEGPWTKSKDDETCIFMSRVYTSDRKEEVKFLSLLKC